MAESIGRSSSGVGFVFPKPLSQKHGSTYFTPSTSRDTHLFGGLGVNQGLRYTGPITTETAVSKRYSETSSTRTPWYCQGEDGSNVNKPD